MKFDYKKMFTFFFKDKKWIKKMCVISLYPIMSLILLFVSALSSLVLFRLDYYWAMSLLVFSFIISLILIFAWLGYGMQAGNLLFKDRESLLPELKDFFQQAFIGLKSVLGYLLILLPYLLIVLAILLINPSYYKETSINSPLLCYILDWISDIYLLIVVFLIPALLVNFFETLSPIAFLDIKRAIGRIKINLVSYIVFAGIIASTQSLLALNTLLAYCLIAFAVFIPFVNVYFMFVIANSAVQYVDITESSDLIEEACE